MMILVQKPANLQGILNPIFIDLLTKFLEVTIHVEPKFNEDERHDNFTYSFKKRVFVVEFVYNFFGFGNQNFLRLY